MKKILFLVFAFTVLTVAQFGPPAEEILSVKSYQSFDNVHPGAEFKVALKVEIFKPWHINSDKPHESYLIPTTLELDEGEFALERVVYPKAHDITLSFSDNPLSVWEDIIYIGGIVKVPENLNPGEYKLAFTFYFQACNDNSCLAPNYTTDTVIVNVVDKQTPVNEINQEVFENIDLSYSEIGNFNNADEDDFITRTLQGSGLLVGLLFVFIGGLALNLTPCVYPLIPITIGYFGGQSEGRTSRLFFMGLMFLAGMAITYSVIGVITALSGAVFGALLQNTYVIIFIALIFVVLSLSMFGVYEFKMPDKLVAKAGGAKTGLWGALFMGLTMGIVAAPCIGPFVIGLVTYVAALADPLKGFLIFFVLALGLGTPYVVLAVFSGKIKQLPRAGLWMESVKHIFGIILLGMALYFLLPLLPKEISSYVLPVYMIIAALYLLIFEKAASKGFAAFKYILSVVLITTAVYFILPDDNKGIEWTMYSSAAIPVETEGKKGMIIDFYADWCIPCKELDAITFRDERVIEESKNFYTFKADMTKTLSPEVEQLREKYKIVGVPTVLILDPSGREIKRITGFVGADEFYKHLTAVN
jgi:thioredoxin:protein disulfide reductase